MTVIADQALTPDQTSAAASTTAARVISLHESSLREANRTLQESDGTGRFLVTDPRGAHALAVGLDRPEAVEDRLAE